ncbi:ATP-binding protein [Nocardia transvalensis]|uniref:ATP-binding protein n=1 Tax=Nocardia transvalensis TaxID=37333 RepID=UPI0018956F32|nr:ATP-binding protein [Nocardia transvalensis]MBF6329580.1 ATP-binding protein [Nocardia transvalensis]
MVTTLRRPRIDGPPDPLDLSFPAIPNRLADVRQLLREWLMRCGVDSDRTYDLLLAATEACSNAMEHGYRGEGGLVRLQAAVVGAELRITIADGGHWKPRDTPPDPRRGRGLTIIGALVPGATVSTGQAGTVVELRMPLEPIGK